LVDLDDRLPRGPLRVRSVWSADRGERLARQILLRRRVLFSIGALAACVCATLVIFVAGKHVLAGSATIAKHRANVTAATATFADGSVAELWGQDADLHVELDSPNRVVAKLTGGARFRVVPNPQRAFEVLAGEVRVRVLGTTFSVQQLPSAQTQVLVEQGRVQVAWVGGATLLQSGEGGVFPPTGPSAIDPQPPSADKADKQDKQAVLVAAPPSPSGARSAPIESVAARRGWRDYALRGDYAKAYDELNSSRDGVRDEASDLMLAADVARLSGHPEQAVQPLRSLCDWHATDRRAPVAAFTLGRVLVDDLGRPVEAAAAFQKARFLWPAGPLAEDALAREADAWQRAGRTERARQIAGQYFDRYPQGRHVAALRKTLGQ
jgi:transmembrane sensor